MMLYWEYFLLGIISFQCGIHHGVSDSEIKFFKTSFPGPHSVWQALLDQHPPKPNHSAIQCGAICRTAPPDTQARVGYQVSTLQTLHSNGYGDIYLGCDLSKGYTIHKMSSGLQVCLLLVNTKTTYTHAVTQCSVNQGFLASAKSSEKIHLLRGFLDRTTLDLWVGATDVSQEGTFVWEEDGTAMTSDQRALFMPGEPSNGDSTEHCLAVDYRQFGLNDRMCGSSLAFVCEMQLILSSVLMVSESSDKLASTHISVSSGSSTQTGGGLVAQTADELTELD